MPTKVRLEMNPAGFEALLKSGEVQADLNRRAEAIADAAGEGFEASGWVGNTRAFAGVRATTMDARRAEATDKALTSAIDAGRG